MNNNKYFDKMYDLKPENWNMLAGVVVETVYDDKYGSSQEPYVIHGNMSVNDAMNHYTGNCQHCNKYHKHFVLVQNSENNDIISVGWQCYNETFTHDSKQELDLHRAKKLAETRAHNAKIAKMQSEYISEHKELVTFLEKNTWSDFFVSLRSAIRNYGKLTERQENSAYNAMAKMKAKQQQKAQEKNEVVKNAPSGRIHNVTFIVKSTKIVESIYGSTKKMLVKQVDDNYKVWVTIPSHLDDSKGEFWGNSWHVEPGLKINMSVTLTPKDDDPSFAWGKRPAKAVVIVD